MSSNVEMGAATAATSGPYLTSCWNRALAATRRPFHPSALSKSSQPSVSESESCAVVERCAKLRSSRFVPSELSTRSSKEGGARAPTVLARRKDDGILAASGSARPRPNELDD